MATPLPQSRFPCPRSPGRALGASPRAPRRHRDSGGSPPPLQAAVVDAEHPTGCASTRHALSTLLHLLSVTSVAGDIDSGELGITPLLPPPHSRCRRRDVTPPSSPVSLCLAATRGQDETASTPVREKGRNWPHTSVARETDRRDPHVIHMPLVHTERCRSLLQPPGKCTQTIKNTFSSVRKIPRKFLK
jgi:hypothetical protein